MQMQIKEIHCFVEVSGEGPVVLLLHGWGANHQAWGRLPQTLNEMGFQTVTIDFPGHGESDEPPQAWTVDDYAAFVHQLLQQLNIKDCHVIAHSFGGRVAIRLASEYPDLFQKIVLVDAAGIKPKRPWYYYIRLYAYKFAKQCAKIGWINRAFGLDQRMSSAGSEDYRALKSDVMRGTFIQVINQDLRPCLPHITAPTLLVWGGEDQDTPLYMAKIMEKEIPNAGLVVFEGAGHYSYLDEFGRFVLIVKSFFLDEK